MLEGGEGRESDDSLMGRAAATFSLQNSTLVLQENFVHATLAEPDIGRAKVINNYDIVVDVSEGRL